MRTHGQEGQALVLALMFLTFFGVIVAGLLMDGDLSLKMTSILQTRNDRLFAAHAGIDHGVERLRLDSTLCPFSDDESTWSSLGTIRVGDQDVDVECQADDGAALGAAGYAIVTRDISQSSFMTQSGENTEKAVEGSVFLGGINDSARLNVSDGDVFEKRSPGVTCNSNGDRPQYVVKPKPPYRYRCRDEAIPDPPHKLPAVKPGYNSAGAVVNAALINPSPVMIGTTCRVFFPGTYTSPPNFTGATDAYFVSGVYYWHNVGEIEIKTVKVIVGKPDPDGLGYINEDPPGTPVLPCAADETAGVNRPNSGYGGKWILGGNSFIEVDNNTSLIEIFGRYPSGAVDEGTANISLMTVPTTLSPAEQSAGWMSTTRSYVGCTSPSCAILSVGNGAKPAFSSHGLVYLPNGYVDFYATNQSKAQVVGGILAGRLRLQSSASALGLVISLKSGPRDRNVVMRATAHKIGGGGTSVVSTAVVTIKNNAARKATIQSWTVAS